MLARDSYTAQKLRETINNYNRIMGSTQAGKDWCIKALHPSDPINEVRGIPDESSVPSLMMNYQSIHTVSPSNGATGTWSLDGQMIPNPLSFGAALYTDSNGPHAAEFLNQQIAGGDHSTRLGGFLRDFQRWRLAYASVTIYQDGPDLANQGTVVVCQKPVEPVRFNIFQQYDPAGVTINTTGSRGLHHAFHMESHDMPDYAASQAMPNAYFGRSKEGVYIPLKLTKTHQTWHSHRDLTYQSNASQLSVYANDQIGGSLTLNNSVDAITRDVYPFLSLNDLHAHVTGLGVYEGPKGELTSDFCNENWADFSFRNMAVTTSLSFFFRFGFEVQTLPTSTLSPHLKISPQPDPVAIESYYFISRELKDAYPAEYNDLGKIWDVISSVAKKVAPALGAVPIVGGVLPDVVRGIAGAGDRIRQAYKNSEGGTRGSVASAADIDALKEARSQGVERSASAPLRPRTVRPRKMKVRGVTFARKK